MSAQDSLNQNPVDFENIFIGLAYSLANAGWNIPNLKRKYIFNQGALLQPATCMLVDPGG